MTSIETALNPHFPAGVRLHFDHARQQWVLLAPERVIELDEVAHAVLRRCDGQRSLAVIIGELAEEFQAEPEEIEPDVLALLAELRDKRLVLP